MDEYVLRSDDFLVSQTNEKGIILFANDDFCKVAGYSLDELVGQPHSIVRHDDMPRSAFEDLWNTVKANQVWHGYVKNRTKNGGFYWVYATVYPLYDEIQKIRTYLSCRRKPSPEEITQAEQLYSTFV